MQEAGGQDLRFDSRPFVSAKLTHTYTVGKVKILTHIICYMEQHEECHKQSLIPEINILLMFHNAAILNNNYYKTTIHLTHRHELMGEKVFSVGRPSPASDS